MKKDKKITNPNRTHYTTAEAANGVSGTSSSQGPTPATFAAEEAAAAKPVTEAAASFLSQMRTEVAQVVVETRKSTAASSKLKAKAA